MELRSYFEWFRPSPVVVAATTGGLVVWLLWSYLLQNKNTRRPFNLTDACLLTVAIIGATIAALVTIYRIVAPPEWDFLCYWVFGQALVQGSPYDASLLSKIAEPLDVSGEFRHELFCLYPPTSVIQFLPLGFMDVRVGAAFWYLLQWVAVLGVIRCGWSCLDENRSQRNLWLTIALVFSFRATIDTFSYAQSSFWITWLVLLMARTSVSWQRGLAVGVATVVKPLGAIFVRWGCFGWPCPS